MLQVVTEIWTLNVAARKTSTIISKSKKGHHLHYMLDRVIVLNCLHRCGGWEGMYKVQKGPLLA